MKTPRLQKQIPLPWLNKQVVTGVDQGGEKETDRLLWLVPLCLCYCKSFSRCLLTACHAPNTLGHCVRITAPYLLACVFIFRGNFLFHTFENTVILFLIIFVILLLPNCMLLKSVAWLHSTVYIREHLARHHHLLH